MSKVNPVYEQAVLRDVEQGLDQTVKIFRQLGLPDAQIAFMFRAVADKIDPPTIIHDAPEMTQ